MLPAYISRTAVSAGCSKHNSVAGGTAAAGQHAICLASPSDLGFALPCTRRRSCMCRWALSSDWRAWACQPDRLHEGLARVAGTEAQGAAGCVCTLGGAQLHRCRSWRIRRPHGPAPCLLCSLGSSAACTCVEPVQLPRPCAVLQESVPTVTSAPRPELIYDYYGFPPESYELKYPAPGDPQLAGRVCSLLKVGPACRATRCC